MKIVWMDRYRARCEAKGAGREVSLLLLEHEPLAPGDIVMVQLGYAIRKMSEEEAHAAWEIYDEILAAEDAAGAR